MASYVCPCHVARSLLTVTSSVALTDTVNCCCSRIVLATVTYSATIINQTFFTALVLLSIVTSQIAGYWLDRTFKQHPTPAEPAATPAETTTGTAAP